MKSIFKIILLTVNCLLLTVLPSCDTIIDLEDSPKGNISLTTDWSNRTSGIECPTDYTVTINNQTLKFTEVTNLLPELSAGTYPVHIYNEPAEVTINGTTATVTTAGNNVNPHPGWLFTAITEAVYTDFKVETITGIMQQQVRQLTIELTVKEGDPMRIAQTEASLSGIANAMDFKANTHTGTNLNVIPLFTRNGDKLTATVRLLGLTSETQMLTLKLKFSDGREQIIEKSLSDRLSNFNTDKYKPLKLEANLNTPVESGFGATITGWKVVEDGSGIAW